MEAASHVNNNNCVICLEPLLTAASNGDNCSSSSYCDLGAAVPCGHPAHLRCWQEWETMKTSSDCEDGVPCPTCQQSTDTFVKVFLQAETDQNKPPLEEIDLNVSDISDDEDEDGDDHEDAHNNSSVATTESYQSLQNNITGSMESPVEKTERRSKRRKSITPTPQKIKSSRLPPKIHRKLFRYKYHRNLSARRLKASQARVKMLEQEAENRKRCHHEDLIELEHSQLLNFKLAKELEQFQDSARFKRNLTAALCFGIGVVWGKLRLFGIK